VTDPVAVALAAARGLGLPTSDPVVIGDGANVNVHLRPAAVVARVTVTLVRGRAALETELAYARAAAERGAPVVPPADDRVQEHDGLHVTFWRYVEHRPPDEADAPAAGRALRELHEATRDLELPLVRFDRLDEAEAVARGLDHPDASLMLDAIRVARERLAQLRFDEHPLHGDAHLRNVFATSSGPLWGDLENVCRGPVEYDLAASEWRTRVHGSPSLVAAYGPHDAQLVDELMPVLAAFLVPWNVRMFQRSDSVESPYLRQRIDYLRTFA
jgi:hypothetical protein